uniref:EB domain-containing protein n=1 Tax=Haemonchus contortus TaxID=6289 RepID=A0A7I4YE98_HAECO
MSLIIASSLLAIATAQYVMPPAGPACTPSCVGGAMCYAGACQCPQPAVVYSPVVGCSPPVPVAPVAPVPMAPAPVVTGRLIPQALPGSPCEPGVECTGGSVCSLGVCLCPPELIQEGTVCVSRTVYSVVPPPAVVVPTVPVAPAVPVALGAPCYTPATPCAPGALCTSGVCQCSPAYTPTASGCILRK